MATTNLDHANLSAVSDGGTVNEDVVQKIFDISPVDAPFTNLAGTMTSGNQRKEWIREDLAAANPQNKVVDGSDASGNDTRTGERLANFHQIHSKIIRVSDRAQDADTVGGDELVKQIMKRGREIRLDLEAALTSRNAAIEDDGATVEGQLAGAATWIGALDSSTNSFRGVGGADAVLSGAAGIGGAPTTAPTAGTKRALSEADVKAAISAAYMEGGNPTVMMSTPQAITLFSDYLFTSSARVATLQSDAPQSNRTNNASGGGAATGGITAQGSVNVYASNFATLSLVPNRFMPEVAAGVSDVLILDPTTWSCSALHAWTVKELARTGLADNRQLSGDYTLVCENPEANAIVADVDTALAAVG
ncbi:MAG: hypothetical protein DRQ46_10660 [Gammaproteobacteria bacterium]|nr:MAG: hypothetical protein DRQ46_10660 [Gammaproteobacteria bacterium]